MREKIILNPLFRVERIKSSYLLVPRIVVDIFILLSFKLFCIQVKFIPIIKLLFLPLLVFSPTAPAFA
jgi:hypothetical protein